MITAAVRPTASLLSVFGKASWWLPSWLDRVLPKLSIEGQDYFAERDAAARVPAPEPEPEPVAR